MVLLGVLFLLIAHASPVAWELTWSDEFEGDALNASRWTAKQNASHCCQLGKQELQLYRADEVAVGGGALTIRTRRRAAWGPAAQGPPRVLLYNYTRPAALVFDTSVLLLSSHCS